MRRECAKRPRKNKACPQQYEARPRKHEAYGTIRDGETSNASARSAP